MEQFKFLQFKHAHLIEEICQLERKINECENEIGREARCENIDQGWIDRLKRHIHDNDIIKNEKIEFLYWLKREMDEIGIPHCYGCNDNEKQCYRCNTSKRHEYI